jgi:hypothetical protein
MDCFVSLSLSMSQSSVFWYTSRMQDDGTEVSVYPRCFDHHSDCDRWAKEGAFLMFGCFKRGL